MESKRDALYRQKEYSMILSHGSYGLTFNTFTVPPEQFIIFVSRTSRYLPQYIIDSQFKTIFTDINKIKRVIREEYHPLPPYLEGLKTRTYGPGDSCPNLKLQMSDPKWPGMGVNHLPLIWREQLKTKQGEYNGITTTLSNYTRKGVTFVVACRAVETQSMNYMGVKDVYTFPQNSTEYALQMQNLISSRSLKRRRDEDTLRKNKNVPQSKRIQR